MNNVRKLVGLGSLLSVTLLTGCASSPTTVSEIDTLRDQYLAVASLPNASQYAARELKDAENAIDNAAAVAKDVNSEEFKHRQFLAETRLGIAGEVIEQKTADDVVAQSSGQRQEALLTARTAEAEAARLKAEMMAERAQQAEAVVDQMANRAAELEESINQLTTAQTERGLVLTLGDILFEVGKSDLKSGAERSIAQVADFLTQYPERSIRIEGFTDSTGADDFNMRLSQERAQAVQDLLTARGVESDRITIQGYGEQYPIASNDSAAGRLQNRRVEIVLSNDDNEAVAARP